MARRQGDTKQIYLSFYRKDLIMHESFYDKLLFVTYVKSKLRKVFFDKDHILVIDMELIGDSVMILPLIHSLKKNSRVRKVDVLCYERQKNIFERCPDVDNVIAIKDINQVVKQSGIPFLRYKLKNFRYLLYLADQLTAKVVNLYNVLMCPRVDSGCQDYMESVAFLSGIKMRYGYTWHDVDERKKKRRQQCFTDLVYSSGKFIWPYECASEFAELCGYQKFPLEVKLMHYEPKQMCMEGGQFLPNKYVVFAMDTTDNFKEWPVENFCKLGEKFFGSGYVPVLVGSKKEYGVRYEKLIKQQKYVNLIGLTSVADAIDIIGSADFYVGGDTGLSHVAGVVGISGIVLFPHSLKCMLPLLCTPQVSRPFGDMICIQPREPLKPCVDKCMSHEKAHCIKQITVDEVWEKFLLHMHITDGKN